MTSAGRPSRSSARAPTSRCASPASRSATSSPRWSSRCSRSAATRPPRGRACSSRCAALDGDYAFETYFSLVLPELPRRRAGAEPHVRAQPEDQPHRDRRRPVPGRGRRPPGDGRPLRVPERRAVRPGPHDASSRSSPSSTPAPPSGRPRRSTARTRSTSSSSAAARPARPRPIYAARKGIRTGVVAERFGGQVLDTMAIENFVSVPYTEGPKLAAALEQHVTEYDVDLMKLQRATRLVPADEPGGLVTVELESGAALQARSVVLSTGARWRSHGRARRGRVPQQGRDLLPALRRAALQGQAGRGDRRRQLRRRGRHRPRRRRRPRHPHRVRRRAAGRRGAAAQAAQPPTTSTSSSARSPPRSSATASR